MTTSASDKSRQRGGVQVSVRLYLTNLALECLYQGAGLRPRTGGGGVWSLAKALEIRSWTVEAGLDCSNVPFNFVVNL